MSDKVRRLSNIKWQATGVDGHTYHTCGEWMYTSDAPPVEADEYERMKQRVKELEALQDQYARDMGVLHKNTTERDRLRLYADKALAMLRSFPASRAENLFSPGIYSQRDDDASAVGWWLAEVRRFLQDDVRQP